MPEPLDSAARRRAGGVVPASQDAVDVVPRQNSNSGVPVTVTAWSKVTVNSIFSLVP